MMGMGAAIRAVAGVKGTTANAGAIGTTGTGRGRTEKTAGGTEGSAGIMEGS